MIDQLSFEHAVRGALVDGPAVAPAAIVERAIHRAARVPQRSVRLALLDQRAWPPRRNTLADPQLRRDLRLLLLAALVALTLTTTIVVGARLLRDRPTPLPLTQRGEFVSLAPVPDRMEIFSALPMPSGRVAFIGAQWDTLSPSGTNRTEWTAKVWTPGTSDFRTIPLMVDKWGAAVAPLPGDRLLLVGIGGIFATDPVPAGSVVDLATGDARPVGPMSTRRLSFGTLALADGRVLVTGGEPPESTRGTTYVDGEPALASAEVFDPGSGRYEVVGPMASARESHGVVQLADGRVLVLGGYSGSEATSEPLRSAELYDPATRTFSPTGALREARGAFTVPPVLLRDRRVLVIGGAAGDGSSSFDAVAKVRRSGTVSTELYDPATGTFAAGPTIPHHISTATVLPDGFVLLTGTWYESFQAGPMVMSSQRDQHDYAWAGLLDPQTGVTREIAAPKDAPITESYLAVAARLPDGRVVVAQGWDANDQSSPDGMLSIFEEPTE